MFPTGIPRLLVPPSESFLENEDCLGLGYSSDVAASFHAFGSSANFRQRLTMLLATADQTPARTRQGLLTRKTDLPLPAGDPITNWTRIVRLLTLLIALK